MKLVSVVCLFIPLSVITAPVSEEGQAQILNYENENDGVGNYKFSFETSNGIERTETGRLVNIGALDEHLVVQGVYSYQDPDGKLVIVRYTADENGYHIDLPELPPILPIYGALPPNAVASLLG